GKTLFGFGGLVLQAGEIPEGGHVAAVIAGLVDGPFREDPPARQACWSGGAETRMGEEAPKRFLADFSFADMFVTVDATGERNLGVVDVEDGDALEANNAVDEFEGRGEAGFALDVIARGEKMGRVEACADLQAVQRVQHFPEFFQARAERSAHAGGVFQQNAERSWRQIL